jgi:hypothetical protein
MLLPNKNNTLTVHYRSHLIETEKIVTFGFLRGFRAIWTGARTGKGGIKTGLRGTPVEARKEAVRMIDIEIGPHLRSETK